MTSTTSASPAPRHDLRRSARMREGQSRSRLTVYLSPDERTLLEARAANTGTSMAKLLIDAAFRPVAAGQIDTGNLEETVASLRDVRRKLEGVATNLNQIAHHANTVAEVPADFDRVVAQVERMTDEVNAVLASVRR